MVNSVKSKWCRRRTVATAKKYKGKDGRIYLNDVYEVTWNAGREKRGRTSVSIAKYGERNAFRRACAIRRQKELLLDGDVVISKWAESAAKVCSGASDAMRVSSDSSSVETLPQLQSFSVSLKQQALALGFDKVGIVRAESCEETRHLDEWLDSGDHADMS